MKKTSGTTAIALPKQLGTDKAVLYCRENSCGNPALISPVVPVVSLNAARIVFRPQLGMGYQGT